LAVAVKVTEVPVQIAPEGFAAIDTVAAETSTTVISIAAEVLEHPPEVTVLRYQVIADKDPGE
jgi:hypothetical protein